jgi:hypothetical protein
MSQTKAQLISDLVQALNFTGTSSAPANGMYLSEANTIKLATNSNGRLTIDSDGNTKFTGNIFTTVLRRDVQDSSVILSGGNATNDGANIALYGSTHGSQAGNFEFRSGAGYVLKIKSDGKVGIGTTNPDTKLHISSADIGAPQNAGSGLMIEGSSADLQFMSANDSYNHIFFGDPEDPNIGIIAYHHASNSNSMVFTTNTATALTLDSTQNATFAGHIKFSGLTTALTNISQPIITRSGSDQGSYPFDSFGHLILQSRGDGTNKDIIFATGTNGANKSIIKASGTVSLGGTTQVRVGNALELWNGFDDKQARIQNSAGSNYANLLFKVNHNGTEATPFSIHPDSTADFTSNVGFGTSSPDARVTVDATSNPTISIKASGTKRVTLAADTGNTEGVLAAYDGYPLKFSSSAGGGTNIVMSLLNNGNVIIGSSTTSTTFLDIRRSENTVYSATDNKPNGLKIFNDCVVDGGFAGIELAATDAQDYYGSTLLKSIATGANYSNDFVIQTRSGGNYAERMRIAHDGATTFSSTVSYTYSTPDGTIDTNISAGTTAGDWVTIIPTGTSGIVSGATYVLRVFWHYDGNGNYPYYCAGGMVWVPVAANDTSSPYGNEVTLPCSYHDAGFVPSLKVRALAGSSVQTGMQATTVGWDPATNSDYRVEYKRIM